jgi:hypothetical protein
MAGSKATAKCQPIYSQLAIAIDAYPLIYAVKELECQVQAVGPLVASVIDHDLRAVQA